MLECLVVKAFLLFSLASFYLPSFYITASCLKAHARRHITKSDWHASLVYFPIHLIKHSSNLCSVSRLPWAANQFGNHKWICRCRAHSSHGEGHRLTLQTPGCGLPSGKSPVQCRGNHLVLHTSWMFGKQEGSVPACENVYGTKWVKRGLIPRLSGGCWSRSKL